MKVVLDANYIINKEIPTQKITEAFIPNSVFNEIKDKNSQDYLSLFSFMITPRDPQAKYIAMVSSKIKDSLLYLSETDKEVVALTLELIDEQNSTWIGIDNIKDIQKIECLSKDNGVRNALNLFGSLNDDMYANKVFKLRCYSCYTMYDTHVDFCKNCGYNTITRVSVIQENGVDKILLKKNYTYKSKTLKDKDGNLILAEDQKEYIRYLKDKQKEEKKRSNLKFLEF